MSLLEQSVDPTGQSSQLDLLSQDVSNLIDTVNGLQESTGNIINEPTYTEVNDGTNNRVLMGFNQVTGTWGLFVTPPGTDLGNATTPQQFSFSSDYPSLAVVDTINSNFITPDCNPGSGVWGSEINTVTIAHGLSYIPVPFGVFFDGSTYVQLPDTVPGVIAGDPYFSQFRVRTDATNVYLDSIIVSLTAHITTATFPATIFLLQQTA
jgi:hypothetical protein